MLCYGTVFDVYNIHMLSVEMQHIHIHNIYGPDYSIGTTFVCLFLVWKRRIPSKTGDTTGGSSAFAQSQPMCLKNTAASLRQLFLCQLRAWSASLRASQKARMTSTRSSVGLLEFDTRWTVNSWCEIWHTVIFGRLCAVLPGHVWPYFASW